jgi:molybdopterin molybdotransferase
MTLKPVEEAVAQVTAGLKALAHETVSLPQARGRILARDVVVTRDQPPFAASAMDGYAVRAEDIGPVPFTLDLIGEAPAGQAFTGKLGPGQAVRVFTGAPMPKGSNRVIIQENTVLDGTSVTITDQPGKDPFVRPRGLDFAKGDVLLHKGVRLNARGLALAASANRPWLDVIRKPKVGILATGNELVLPGGTPEPSQIISSNNFALQAFVERFGGEAHDLGIARDDIEELVDKTKALKGFDILVTIGGASVGDHDLVKDALTKAGLKLEFWKIAMRPGKPLIFGELGDIKVLGLPGNPVSALVCARIFLKPMLERLLGQTTRTEETIKAQLAGSLPDNGERQAYLRARLAHDGTGMPLASPYKLQDSAMLRTLHDADCLIVRPPHAPAAGSGDIVDILPLDF